MKVGMLGFNRCSDEKILLQIEFKFDLVYILSLFYYFPNSPFNKVKA